MVIEVTRAWKAKGAHDDPLNGHSNSVELWHTSYRSEREGIDADFFELVWVAWVLHCNDTDGPFPVGQRALFVDRFRFQIVAFRDQPSLPLASLGACVP